MDINKVFAEYEKLTSLELLKGLGTIILEADDFVIFLQQKQLSDGLNSEGNLTGTYTAATQFIAENFEPKPIKPKIEGQPFNFEYSGRFFKGMFLKVFVSEDFRVEIESAVSYADDIENRYKKLLGLTKDNQEELIEFVNIKLAEQINKRFQ